MNLRDGIIAGICLAIAIGAYAIIGEPFRPDQPMSARQAELAAKAPADMTPAETLARLEQLTIDRPDDPQPHAFIGNLLRAQGRDADAVRAYQSSLRRDDRFVPALLGLADAYVRLESGAVGGRAQQLYDRAYQLDASQTRAGFMAGLADWQAGAEAAATAKWNTVRAGVAADDPRRAMVDAWIDAAKTAE